MANNAHALDGGRPRRLQIEPYWPATSDAQRWAASDMHMRRFFITYLLAVGVLTGCSTDHERQLLDKKFFWSDRSSFAAKTTAAEQCAIANDSARDPEERARSVATLFANFVKPGYSSEQMRSAIPDNRWLRACSVSPCGAAGGGSLPIFNSFEFTPFTLRLFPDATGWSDWAIIFSLPSDGVHGARSSEKAFAFLFGEEQDKRVRLEEFDIWYPICGSRSSPTTQVYLDERFTGKRVGVKLPFH